MQVFHDNQEPLIPAPLDDDGDDGNDLTSTKGSSIGASVSVFANTILGVALLGLPWCFSTNGLLLGSTLLLVCACLSGFGLFLLDSVAHELLRRQRTGKLTFLAANRALFPRFKYSVDVVILIKALGVATSYLLVVGDVVPDMLLQIPFTAKLAEQTRPLVLRSFSIIFVVVFLIVPASLPRRIRSTRFTNWVSVGCVVYVAAMAVTLCVLDTGAVPECQNPITPSPKSSPSSSIPITKSQSISLLPRGSLPEIASTLPVFIFAFTCHQNAFSVASELKRRTLRRLLVIILLAVSISLSLYVTTALAGYIQFGNCIDPDVLNSYDSSLTAVKLGKIFVAISVIFSFPLQCHPFRASFAVVCSSDSPEDRRDDDELKLYRLSTTIFFLITTGVALTVRNLGILFEVVGVVCSNTLCYIVPSALYLKMFSSKEDRNAVWRCAWVLLIFGLLVLPLCLGCILFVHNNGSQDKP